MTNFKSKILNTLKNENKTDATFKYLSNIQNNLIKNYSNPVFSNSDKNKLLEKHNKIKNIGELIYKHRTLKQNNLNSAAESEKENATNLILKGGISNCKYIWHSENSDTTCDECSELDGQEFDFEDEVPERSHPNCKCTVEIVEYNDENEEPDDELCDCCQAAEQIEETLCDAESLNDELTYELEDIDNTVSNLPDKISEKARSILLELLEKLEEIKMIIQTIFIFKSNFQQLLDIEDGKCDKYYHAKANREASQLGVTGEAAAKALSDYKELFDSSTKAIVESIKLKTDFQQALIEKIKDSDEDQKANREGREAGRNNPEGNCGEILKYKLPENRRW